MAEPADAAGFKNLFPKKKVTEKQMAQLALFTHNVYPQWSYTLLPRLADRPKR